MDAKTKFSTLFSPGDIDRLKLANRAVVSPMTRTSATHDGLVTRQMVDYYATFARGGWGLVITEATYTDKKYSQGYIDQPGIADDAQAESWVPVVEAVHAQGLPIFLQLIHAGAVNQGNNWVEGSIAPSAIRPLNEQIDRYGGKGPFQVPREITREEIDETVAGFAEAARRGVEAGFDGIEIHGANGYLPDQFLTVYTNTRTDEYGGPIENRFRYHMRVVKAVREAVPADRIVGVRMSQTKVNDFTYEWPGGAADAAHVFGALGTIPGIYVHIAAHLGCAPVFGTGLSLAGLAKKHSGHPVIANGKLQDPAEAERILAQGEADFVAIAKGALADPAWPDKVRTGLDPVPFDPGMVTPLATLANTENWRKARRA